jgi:chitin synthase
VNKVNEDATELFHTVFRNQEDKEAIREYVCVLTSLWWNCLSSISHSSRFDGSRCLNELFFHAEIDHRFSKTCARIATSQYALAGVLAFLILVQVGCSLAYIARRPPMVRDEDKRAAVMVMVPCYNESDNELRKTIDSVLANDYPDENRVLVVVADGVITGRGETKSCPATLAEILGFTFDPYDDAQAYESVGAITTNYASIYHGTYSSTKYPGKALKYIVVVKQGGPKERGTARAGNRGKRDSQLLLFGILNRIQYNRRPTDLDLVFMNALRDLSLSCIDIEYLMAIDADTRVSKDAIKYFVYKLDHDKSVLACCGETQVDNKAQSFVTMIQVRIGASRSLFCAGSSLTSPLGIGL